MIIKCYATENIKEALFDRFEISMTVEDAKQGSHQDQCDADVAELCKLPHIKEQLDKISDEDLVAELSEYGAWEEDDLKDRTANEHRIIWIAAGNINDTTEDDQ